jgi:hypothetical protein
MVWFIGEKVNFKTHKNESKARGAVMAEGFIQNYVWSGRLGRKGEMATHTMQI